LASAAVTSWVAVAAAIQQTQSAGPAAQFVRGEVELLVAIAATLVAAFVVRGPAAGVVLLALGAALTLTGLVAGAAWVPLSAPLLWSGLAAIGAGVLAAVGSRRSFVVIPLGLVIGVLAWSAQLAFL
jgi:hypothetical protein